MCNPSEGIPADVTGGDDVATRKYKSTCGGDSGSFKVKEALAGMQEVWHATQRLVPSGNHGYIRNLGRSPSGTRAASKTLWERQCPRHHTDKSLPSVERHSLGREDWGARSGIKVQAVEPDKSQRGGPSCSITNIVHRNTRWEGLGGRHTSSRMSSDPQRWGEIRRLVCSGNSIYYPPAEGLLVSRKTLLIRTVAHKQLVWLPPQGSSVDVCVQCSHWNTHN